MKLVLIDMFKSASGKVCQDSDFYTATRNGKTYTGRICHPSNKEPTADQVAFRTKFKGVIAKVNDIMKAGVGNDLYDSYLLTWKSLPYGKYPTLRGYIFAKEWEKA